MSKPKYVIRECCHTEYVVKENDDSPLGEGVEASFMGPNSKERAEEYLAFLETKETSVQINNPFWSETYRSMDVAEFFNLLAYKTKVENLTKEEAKKLIDKKLKITQEGNVVQLSLSQAQQIIESVEAVQRAPGCWCEHGIGNPNYNSHTKDCAILNKVMELFKEKAQHEAGVR